MTVLESAVISFLWQVSLHSLIAAGIAFSWASRLDLPSGRARRRLLAAVLVLPLLTALVPGRGGTAFREQVAWLDSGRLLALPILGGLQVAHLMLAVFAVTALVFLWQELVPVLLRERDDPELEAPESVTRLVWSLPRWGSCRIGVNPGDGIGFATGGRPSRPWLSLTRGALERLNGDELEAVLRHENAHWAGGRWLASHLLFGVRLLQACNPLALWIFREYTIEVEIDCDREAAEASGPRPLARALLKVYEGTDRRDAAGLATLRKRIGVLAGQVRRDDEALPATTLAAAVAVLGVFLPWIV